MKLVSALQTRAQLSPNAVAIREGSLTFSYAQWWQEVERLSALLLRHKVSCLGLALPNCFMWLACDLAAQLAKVPVVAIPSFFTSTQRAYILKESGCDFLITHDAVDTMNKVSDIESNIYFYSTGIASLPLPTQTAKITFTSGSTAQPKGVCLSLPLIESVSESLSNLLQSIQIKRHSVFLPLSILLENIAGVYVPLLLNAQIILKGKNQSSSMTMEVLSETLKNDAPNSLLLTAQALRALISITKKDPESISSLNFVAVGGSKISPTLLRQATELKIPIYEGYGLSECGSVVSINTPDANRIASAGKPLPDVSLRVANDGEIIVKRSHLLGYVKDNQAPTEIHTGDIGYIDSDGFLFVTGRKKSVFINSFGRNFSPEWIEAEAQCFTSFAHLVVFGEAKPFNVAIIQPTTQDLSAINKDILNLNNQLPDYAQIKHYILTDSAFTPQNGLLTYNGRPKRQAVYNHYQSAIDSFYYEGGSI